MLHVRVVSSPDATDRLVERLTADPGVRNLIVVRAAARRPDGDAVQFDLVTRFANPVLGEVRAQIGDRGSVVIENFDGVASGPEDQEGALGIDKAATAARSGTASPPWWPGSRWRFSPR
jgi:hypothetical protein